MRKPDFCLCENKGVVSSAVNAQPISPFVFDMWIVQFLLYLLPNFFDACIGQFVSDLVGGPGPEDPFSIVLAHIFIMIH